jgi:hypothetical protein
MISLQEIMYETKEMISEEDKDAFRDLDLFIKSNAETYLTTRLKRRYANFVVKPIPVSDFQAVLPKYYEIVQISGSDNEEIRRQHMHSFIENSEVAAFLRKDHEDNIYTVIKNKNKCSKEECDTELLMQAEIFHDELARGANYSIIRKFYTDHHEDKDGCWKSSLDRNYHLMHPRESNLFGLKEQFIKNCINFDAPRKMGHRYEFDIQYSPKDRSKILKTNFKEGIILLSFYGRHYDDEGYLMLPDMEDAPNLLMATRYYIEKMIFQKLRNQYKTNDYVNIARESERLFKEYNREAVKELNDYTFEELATIIARAKFHHNTERTQEALVNRDHPDKYRRTENELFNY